MKAVPGRDTFSCHAEWFLLNLSEEAATFLRFQIKWHCTL